MINYVLIKETVLYVNIGVDKYFPKMYYLKIDRNLKRKQGETR